MSEETVGLNLLGKPFRCTVCEGERFQREGVMTKLAARGPMGLGYASRKATCLICVNCGYVHWFFPQSAEGTRTFNPDGPPAE